MVELRGRVLLILVLCGLVFGCALILAGEAAAVDAPKENGDYEVGWNDTVFENDSPNPTHDVRIYYPATSEGADTPPDDSGAPYPIVYFHSWKILTRSSVHDDALHLASYGFIVQTVTWVRIPGQDPHHHDIVDAHLDILIDMDTMPGSVLYGMVDKDNFGIAGSGVTFFHGAKVTRFDAIYDFDCWAHPDVITWSEIALIDDPVYIHISLTGDIYNTAGLIYAAIDAPKALVRDLKEGSYHYLQRQMMASFLMVHLKGMEEYSTFIYGKDIVSEATEGTLSLEYSLTETDFFPPEATIITPGPEVDMDEDVEFSIEFSGYDPKDHPDLSIIWRVDDSALEILDTTIVVSHTFNAPGNYKISAHYNLGEVHNYAVPVYIDVLNVVPIAEAGDDISIDHETSDEVNGDQSTDTGSDIDSLQYKWSFSDGTGTEFSDVPSTSVPCATCGEITATITVKDQWGGESTDTLMITVNNVLPPVDAGPDQEVSEDDVVTLTGFATDTPSHVGSLEYMWDLGDGTETEWSSENGTTHTYTLADDYTVTLSVRDADGGIGTGTLVVTVSNVPPTCTIDSPSDKKEKEEGDKVSFTITVNDTVSDKDSLLVLWMVDDKEMTDWISLEDAEAWKYEAEKIGERKITLMVKDDDGETAEHTMTLDVKEIPSISAGIVLLTIVGTAIIVAARRKY